MLNEIIDAMIVPVVLGLPFAIIGGVIFRAHRAGTLKSSGHAHVNTLPAYNTNGTPMIPGSSFDVTGSPYGGGSNF